ncbi:hypothetical protein BDA96_06G281500 [Sorghum bicolor]|uniref:Uncharacterized protein n=2 Tax=Sorghum bicolor TaxID=4558 RepID=A0A921QGC7_SORBI|nr:hypothetical protein BDA96_08G064800 [Sorghum bicolor]KAG0528003.1 hypothetical protein BDA96_06G281500 [Sorghum bicolor]OQU88380.1 hypothetical protein SORBI_3002G020950 [Sorghum bicolor]
MTARTESQKRQRICKGGRRSRNSDTHQHFAYISLY